MAKSPKNRFSASESMQGYLYQCHYALLLLLQRNRATASVRMSVEKFDDVAFERGGQPRELIQTKHRTQPGNLTDLSEDLWKTLRIWSEGVRDNNFPLPGTVFSLITTQTAPAGGAAALLRAGAGRDVAKAATTLVAAASATTNAQIKDTCDAFLKLSANKRNAMLADVYVHDATAQIADLEQQLLQEVYYAAPSDNRTSFLEQLEGWWFRRVIRHLTTPSQPPFRGVEVEKEMERLKDGYTDDNLPIEIPLPDPPTPPDPASDPREFVVRLRKVDVPSSRVRRAILDFYRAYVHRDRWAKDTLLRFNELEQYDERLQGEWERLCDDLLAELDGVDDEAKTRQGRDLFQRLDSDAAREVVFFIRPRCTEPSISRGSLHKLADEGRLAWHPEDSNAVRAKGAGPAQLGGKP
jgi:hypothetical protein